MDRDLIPGNEDHEDDNEEKDSGAERRERRAAKKDQIISLFTSGMGSVEDLAMTVYQQLGINGEKKLMAPGNRPIDIVREGALRKDLIA